MRTHRLLASAALALVLALAFVAPALGAEAPESESASTPVKASAGGPIEVQVWPGQGGQTAVISAVVVDATVKLPVTVRIPVVPGTKVEWAGEILGGQASGDIQQQFKLVQGRGGQFAEFTLTKSHRGQIDAIGAPLKLTGDIASVSVEYVQSVDSTLTTIGARIPATVSKVKISPTPVGRPATNLEGESLYTLQPRTFKPGEKQKIEISYSTLPPVEPAPGSELNPVLIGLGIALTVAVIAMIVIVRRNAPLVTEASEDDASADEGAEAESKTMGPEGADDDDPDLDFE